MNILSEKEINEKQILSSIFNFCKQYKVGQILKSANAYKNKGIPAISIFSYLLQLVYTKKSMHMNLTNNSHKAGFLGDVVYRFLNTTSINWAAFLLKLSAIIINNKFLNLTSKKRINAIIIDDTLYSRARSKKVELLANVHDHTHKGTLYKRGFRMLTLAWTDGVSLIPLFFRHLSSEKKTNRYNEINNKIDKRSCGYKARMQAISTSPKVLLEALAQIVKFGIPAKHVLFDSWFSFPSTIMEINKLGLKVVSRLKNTRNIKYLIEDKGKEKEKTLSQIYASRKKRPGKSKYLLSVKVKIYNKNKEQIEAKIVYVRERKNKKKWIAFICTDMEMSEKEIIGLYGKRWGIEVFFRVCKSYLNLGTEFQQISYDAIVAHTTVVMVRYMILALEKRNNDDPRSWGPIFYGYYDEIADIQFAEVLELLISVLHSNLVEYLFLSDEQIEDFIEKFLLSLPEHFKPKRRLKKIA